MQCQQSLISSLLLSGQDLLRILSQQDQQASGSPSGASPGDALPPAGDSRAGLPGLPDQALAEEGEAQEPVAAAAAHVVGGSDGAPTAGQDEELRDALAAETEHMVREMLTPADPIPRHHDVQQNADRNSQRQHRATKCGQKLAMTALNNAQN